MINLDGSFSPCFLTVRWKNTQTEGLRAEMSYCRKHFLNRTALMTIEVTHTHPQQWLFLTQVISLFHLPPNPTPSFFQDIKHELMKMMEQAGFWSSRSKAQAIPLTKQHIAVLNAVLTAGLYDSVARVVCTPSVDVLERVACTVETPQGKAQVHPSSVNRNLQTHGWLLYQEKV